jgi:hypothetical protein
VSGYGRPLRGGGRPARVVELVGAEQAGAAAVRARLVGGGDVNGEVPQQQVADAFGHRQADGLK